MLVLYRSKIRRYNLGKSRKGALIRRVNRHVQKRNRPSWIFLFQN
ncbi:hypothetical protein JMUB7519_28130 [Staphylococcus aureus]